MSRSAAYCPGTYYCIRHTAILSSNATATRQRQGRAVSLKPDVVQQLMLQSSCPLQYKIQVFSRSCFRAGGQAFRSLNTSSMEPCDWQPVPLSVTAVGDSQKEHTIPEIRLNYELQYLLRV